MGGRNIKLSELLLGFEGLALLRGLVDATDEDMAARLEEIRDMAAKLDEQPYAAGIDVDEHEPRAGYEHWSRTYDTENNPLLVVEQEVVERILTDVAPGRALDAACGTGRHARHLAANHQVTGVDGSPHMLALASEALPSATFVLGDLTALPLPDATYDVVVCALALCHVADARPAVAELARVAAAGARVVISDPHPMAIAIISQGFFQTPTGRMGFVRNHYRSIGDYLEAFGGAGLNVLACREPVWRPEHAGGLGARFVPGAMQQALTGLPAAIIWELEKEA